MIPTEEAAKLLGVSVNTVRRAADLIGACTYKQFGVASRWTMLYRSNEIAAIKAKIAEPGFMRAYGEAEV